MFLIKSNTLLLLAVGIFSLALLISPTFADEWDDNDLSNSTFSIRSTIRDTIQGIRAAGINCSLYRNDTNEDNWNYISNTVTGSDGNANFFVNGELPVGTVYRFQCITAPYYESQSYSTFYPYIDILFEKQDTAFHLIPLTMSPYGFSAYRGHIIIT